MTRRDSTFATAKNLRPSHAIMESVFHRYITMAGVKRSINGLAKPQNKLQEPEDVAMTDATPSCGQPQPPSSETTSSISTSEKQEKTSKPNPSTKKPSPTSLHPKQPTKPRTTNAKLRQKLPKLPKSTYTHHCADILTQSNVSQTQRLSLGHFSTPHSLRLSPRRALRKHST